MALGPRDRVTLAVLAVRPGQHVTADALAEALWGDDLPPSSSKVVQGCVSRLRKVLGATAIETTPGGYRLRLHRDDLDLALFEHHLGRARQLLATGEPDRVLYLVDQALALWRGDPFGDLSEWEPGRTEAERLAELHREAEELRVEAALQSGRHDEVLPDLRRLVVEQPTRERRWGLLALAQYQAGRQAEALQTLARARAVLLNELGLDPGPGLAALEESILRQDSSLAAQAAFTPASTTCPYLGLLAYDLEDAAAFFGREQDTEAALRRLDQTGVLAVVGPSGSGKSSLVRAGVAAALERDGRDVSVLTPGRHPLAALDAVRPQAADVLVVDQCEEVLGLPEESGDRSDFFERLVTFAARPGRQLVISLRADRLGDLSIHTDFARLVEQGLYLLGPLREPDLRRAIESPAAQAGLRIEPGLVDLLVREVLGEAGALPLLSHVLRQTWKRREGNTLTVAGYTATGGIRGAVSQSAEGLFRGLSSEQQVMVRDLMVRLVASDDAGAPIRQRVPRRSVLTTKERQELAERLIAARLLSSDGETLEVAHESLAVAWPRLRGWLDDDVDGLRIMRHLTVAAQTWDELGRPDSELYRGVRLARAIEWRGRSDPTLTPVEAEFLTASAALADREAHAAEEQARRDRRSNQRLRAMLAATAALLSVTVVAGIAAFTSAERASSTALTSDSERLGAEAARTDAVDLSLLLAAAGLKLEDSVESRTNLLEALNRVPRLIRATRVPSSGMAVVTVLPDGRVALPTWPGGVQVYDPDTLAVTGRGAAPLGNTVVASPTGRLLAASVNVPTAAIPPVALLQPDGSLAPGQLGGLSVKDQVRQDLSFDSTGRWLAVGVLPKAGPEGTVLVWDTERPQRPVARVKTSQSIFPVVSPDGRTLYSRDRTRILVTDLPEGTVRRVLTAADLGVQELSGRLLLTPDARTLVVGGGPAAVVIDATTLASTSHLYDGQAWSGQLALSADGTRVSVLGDKVVVWDLSGAEPVVVAKENVGDNRPVVSRPDGRTLYPNAAGLSPDGRTLYLYVDDNFMALDLEGRRSFLPVVAGDPLDRDAAWASLSPDRTRVAYHWDGLPATNQVRDLTTGRLGPRVALGLNTTTFTEVVWSPDGRLLSSTTGDSALGLWEAATGREVARTSLSPEEAVVATFSPDGNTLLVGTRVPPVSKEAPTQERGRLHVLSVPGLQPVRDPIEAGVGLFDMLTVSPNGRDVVAHGEWAQTIDYSTGQLGAAIGAKDDPPSAGEFSPDGQRLFLSWLDGRIALLDVTTDSWLAAPSATQPYGGRYLAWSVDGSLIASSKEGGKVAVWDGRTGAFVGAVAAPEGAVAFTEDGEVLVASLDGTVRTWDPRPSAWVAAACRMAGRDLTEDEWRSYLPDRDYAPVCS
ncbi:BTAD domain-containing putative transcriptional regulator [Intrasporangium calvum]|uniref:nSTAND1 domain-containing NTPase n=1 Tax=Intrasporangium calvum TaxID=53358 RepID=UPI00145D74DE|nr:BTAD domain-containing putative transcriptional regulator [Intrasporangium calvum]